MADEVQELILKVQGQLELNALNLKLKEEAGLLAQAILKLKEAGGSHAGLEAEVKRLGGTVLGLNNQIAGLSTLTSRFSGQGGLQMAYVLDDLANTSGDWSRHLAAISNNMPGLIMSLGGTAGLAGGLGLVFTAVVALIPVVRSLWHEFMTGQPEMAKEKLKEIEQAAKDLKKAFDALNAAPSGPQDIGAEGAKLTFAGQPGLAGRVAGAAAGYFTGAEVTAAMNEQEKAALMTAGPVMDDAEIERIAHGQQGDRTAAQVAAYRKQLQKKRDEAISIRAGIANQVRQRLGQELVTGATGAGLGGESARGRLGRMAMAEPGAFPVGFGEGMIGLTGPALEAGDKEADEWLEKMENISFANKAKHAQAAKDAKETKRVAAAHAGEEADMDEAKKMAADKAKKGQHDAEAARRKAAAEARHGVVQGKRDAVAARHLGEQQQLSAYAGWFEGQGASSEQALAMAHDTVRGMKQGLSLSQASFEAWTDMQKELRQIQMHMMQLQNGFQAGKAANGRQLGNDAFSFQSPMPGQ